MLPTLAELLSGYKPLQIIDKQLSENSQINKESRKRNENKLCTNCNIKHRREWNTLCADCYRKSNKIKRDKEKAYLAMFKK